ncbi:MAG: DUF1934 domain-containing protein [Eubacteriales bacterium]|nr:DUF1934 domain-containing protein [Eubacteriales bacterium]
MTKDVIVRISGFQDMEGEQDGVEVITAGSYYMKNGRHYIVYEELMDGFGEKTRNVVKVSPDKLDIIKSGAVRAHLVFETDKKAVSHYATPMGEMVVGMSTNRINLEEQEDSLRLLVDYSLEINYDHVSDCSITMDVCSRASANLELQA